MAAENLRQHTVDEFEALADSDENRDRILELTDGEIVEKLPTEEHGMTAGNIYAPIGLCPTKARYYLSHGTWLGEPGKAPGRSLYATG